MKSPIVQMYWLWFCLVLEKKKEKVLKSNTVRERECVCVCVIACMCVYVCEWTAVHLTSYSDYLTGFCEPLSPSYRRRTGL